MDWKDCKYASIAQLISDSEVEKMIEVMIENCDKNDKYYDFYKKEELLKTYVHNLDFFTIVDEIARKEIENEYRDNNNFFDFFEDLKDGNKICRKDYIYETILSPIKSIAIQRRNERFFSRLHIGDKVVFGECEEHSTFLEKVEFYKEGGWGLADVDGTVILKNHLKKQPSKISPLISKTHDHYLLICDRDTELYGVLSLISFKEVIHCLYQRIEVLEYFECRCKKYIIKVERNNKWGCFDENCALLLDCKYDDIHIKGDYIECIYDGKEYFFDTLRDKGYERFIDGKKDLYNMDGVLVIGGYSQLDITYGYMQFYWGTKYEHYNEKEIDIHNNEYNLSKLRLNYDESRCLILDRNFKTIIRNKDGIFQLPRGINFDSEKDITDKIPSDILFKYRVDLSHIHDGFIYLHNYWGEQFIVPFYIMDGFYSLKDFLEHKNEEAQAYKENSNKINELIKQFCADVETTNSETHIAPNYSNEFLSQSEFSREIFLDDSSVTIIKINEKKEIEWIGHVNEILTSNYKTYIYRRGKKYGFYNKNGLDKATYNAISRDTHDGRIYVALYENCDKQDNSIYNNPNLDDEGRKLIHFFSLENGVLCRLDDDWASFNPTDYKWFPYDFIENNYKYKLRESLCEDCDNGSEWTDEDAWDAMTDGAYGDYPGPGWDPEHLGF